MRVSLVKALSAILSIAIVGLTPLSAAAGQTPNPRKHAAAHSTPLPLDQPRPLPGPRPDAATIEAWQSRRFGMFIHFGLYSTLGGIWQGKKIDNGYSEQIMGNASIPLDEYAALASSFNPTKFDPDAIVALAKAAGMKYIVITAKHHDGFNMYGTKQTSYNVVDATPFHQDVVKLLSQACARGGIKFGVYYSSIDWHAPEASPYVKHNSNPIPPAHEAFNVRQLKELLSNYGSITEIWFDMGGPTAEQSRHFASTVHDLQPATMVSGRVFNSQGDFSVMGDNAVPSFVIDEPWQTPASIFGDTWGYRSWENRTDLPGKIRENILRLVEVASRGGNFILNIGPEGDGSIVPYEADVLRGIGEWMKRNGKAIYSTNAQPFRSLDFGYATVGRGVIYLFVKSVPQDAVLRLPTLKGVTLQPAYLLKDPTRTPIKVAQSDAGVTLSAQSLGEIGSASAPADFLPVIAIPFKGKLQPQLPVIEPGANGVFALTPGQADTFYNYNGNDYWAPPTTYKLRWTIAAPQGRYDLRIRFSHAERPAKLTLFVNGVPVPINLEPSPAAGTDSTSTASLQVNLRRKASSLANQATIEITPRAPFYKGTKLPAQIEEVDFVPVKD
jgi:alpha-L-fucosidase